MLNHCVIHLIKFYITSSGMHQSIFQFLLFLGANLLDYNLQKKHNPEHGDIYQGARPGQSYMTSEIMLTF